MEHYTVTINYPLEYKDKSHSREEIEKYLIKNGFATEKWMNEEYLIDYRVVNIESTSRVQVLLHKDNPGIEYQFKIQQYISEDVFSQIPSASASFDDNTKREDYTAPRNNNGYTDGRWQNQYSESADRTGLLFALSLLLIITFIAVGRKHRSMVKAHQTLEQVQWARTDWEPPKIEIASFRKEGLIAEDLDEFEAALLWGYHIKQFFRLFYQN